MLNGRYIVLAVEFGEIQQHVPIWQGHMIERLRVRVPIHVCLIFGLQAEMILDHIGYLVSPVFVLHCKLRNCDAGISINI
jgi:hypothetical protein